MPSTTPEEKVAPEALQAMREALKTYPKARWAAFQNMAMDSASFGHLQFLAIGPTNTYKVPPQRMPDTQAGTGWKYLFAGWVDLETGEVRTDRCRRCGGDTPAGTYHACGEPNGYCSVNCEKNDAEEIKERP